VPPRLDPSWSILVSPSSLAVDRCVDIFVRPDGSFGFEEFRRDPEDMGAWTPVAYYSTREFETKADALFALRQRRLVVGDESCQPTGWASATMIPSGPWT